MFKQKQPHRKSRGVQPMDLRRIDAGLYVDDADGCYLCISEFLAAQRLPDVPEIREVLLEEIDQCFPEITCVEFSD
jgi:hypothetical protein